MDEIDELALDPELDDQESEDFEFDEEVDEEGEGEYADESEEIGDEEIDSPLSEEEEMELAADLLEVTDDSELDQFLGKLFKKIRRGAKKLFKWRPLRKVGRFLRKVAKKALPVVGGAVGSIVPGVGTAIGAGVGSAASRLFEMELEGLSPEDQEFEVARRFVRFAASAANKAASGSPNVPSNMAAKKAIVAAAKRHAPGLLKKMSTRAGGSMRGSGRMGRWIRRGRKIIVLGV